MEAVSKKAKIIMSVGAIVAVSLIFVLSGVTEKVRTIEKAVKKARRVMIWKDIPLTDVVTGQIFNINDFSRRPVILDNFAIWDPVSEQQQDEINKIIEEENNEIIFISLNIDPMEDSYAIEDYVKENNFSWPFVDSPIELTRAMFDRFGIHAINAPAAPLVLICPDQRMKFMGGGLKSASELKREAEETCSE